MENKDSLISDLPKSDKSKLIMDMFMRTVVHYGLWFSEIRHQKGMEKALEMLDQATDKFMGISMKRFSNVLGFELENGLPKALMDMDDETLDQFIKAVGVNWLVNDGVWFQSLEFDQGMIDAKLCNDSCWAKFSPYEAFVVKKFLGLGDDCGLEGLKKALNFRMYASINEQSIEDEGENSFVFQMNDCRVQAARKRKNLDDYPCKSGGLIEYQSFARAVDQRIKMECIGCPPDPHPEQWYCAWRFSM